MDIKKRAWCVVALLAVLLPWGARPAAAAINEDTHVRIDQPASNDSIGDRVGDWFATLGKSQDDKQRILTQRRLERSAHRVGESLKSAANNAADAVNRGVRKLGDESERVGERIGRDADKAY